MRPTQCFQTLRRNSSMILEAVVTSTWMGKAVSRVVLATSIPTRFSRLSSAEEAWEAWEAWAEGLKALAWTMTFSRCLTEEEEEREELLEEAFLDSELEREELAKMDSLYSNSLNDLELVKF